MENFLLPSKVEFQDGPVPHSGLVIITPCYHGYGTTLGNAFRRVLLSSLPGAAVEYFKIKGVQHEFSTIEGVKEDVMEVMLNLKQLVVKVFSDDPVTLQLVKKKVQDR
jgi:DNA-directed RNA polymerase subunit alpha